MKKFETLPQIYRHVKKSYNSPNQFNVRRGNKWQHFSTEHFLQTVQHLALGLRPRGVMPGDRVGIVGPSSPQWLMIDLASLIAGAVTVPMFARLAPENFAYQIKDADVRTIFVTGTARYRMINQQRDHFHNIITLQVPNAQEGDFEFEDILKKGEALAAEQPELFEQMIDQAKPRDMATIIYTSGSTGVPKGVMLCHENIVSQVYGSMTRFPVHVNRDRAVTVLPFAHVFERMVIYFYLATGTQIFFVEDVKQVAEVYQEVKPTIGTVVPRLLEKVYAKIQTKLEAAPFPIRQIGRWALKLAKKPELEWWERPFIPLIDVLVYRKLRAATGGCFRSMISGGAALNPELAFFFRNIGVALFQGYGLTESSPVIACNFPGSNKIGSVGPTYPGVEIKLGEGGELLARGPNIMLGYYNDPEKTKETIDEDGWLHTGDVASIDENGFVTITGRIKEIQKTSGGKMISPVPIEQKLCDAPMVDMAMVVAEGRRYVTALLAPDPEELSRIKKQLGVNGKSDIEVLELPEIRDIGERLLREVNKNLGAWEKIRRFRWLPETLTVEGGELTPTLKIRRKIVEEKYHDLIEGMY